MTAKKTKVFTVTETKKGKPHWTQEGQDAAVLVIAKGLRNIPMVADQEINLAATLVELCQID